MIRKNLILKNVLSFLNNEKFRCMKVQRTIEQVPMSHPDVTCVVLFFSICFRKKNFNQKFTDVIEPPTSSLLKDNPPMKLDFFFISILFIFFLFMYSQTICNTNFLLNFFIKDIIITCIFLTSSFT